MSRYLSICGWCVLLAAVPITALYHFSITSQLKAVKVRIAYFKEENKRLRKEVEEGEALRQRAFGGMKAARNVDRAICDMLRKNAGTSREDFIVREGPCIAWGEVARSPQVTKLALYLPSGKHRLKFGVIVGPVYVEDRLSLLAGNTDRIQNVTSVELGPDAEVYELEVRSDPGGGAAHFSVRGGENALVHQSSLPPGTLQGAGDRPILPKDTFVFPSEVMSAPSTSPPRYWFSSRGNPPTVNELASLTFGREKSGKSPSVWIWTESEAPACMSATEVACRYEAVVEMFASNNEIVGNLGLERAEMFTRLFKAYDGFGFFHFNDGVFAKQMPEERAESEVP